jgi:hypothetical protein
MFFTFFTAVFPLPGLGVYPQQFRYFQSLKQQELLFNQSTFNLHVPLLGMNNMNERNEHKFQ